jgi:hypothetical protein
MDYSPYDEFKMNEALNQQQLDGQKELYAPQLQEQVAASQAVVISETDPTKDINQLLLKFRGYEEVDGELKRVREPIMNESGVNKISQILTPLMINTIRFTRLKEAMIKSITERFLDDLTYDLGLNWRDYDIPNRNSIDHILNALATLIFSVLSRAEDQNEKNWLGKISFENVNPNKYEPKKSESWLDRFKL